MAQSGLAISHSSQILYFHIHLLISLSLVSSPSRPINTSDNSPQHSPQPVTYPKTGTPYIALHPPLEPLPPDLSNVEDQLFKVIQQFESNVYSTQESFEKSSVPVNAVCSYLKRKKRSYIPQAIKKQTEIELNEVLDQITTYDGLFDLLDRYISWFNHEIFIFLAKTFLKNDDSLLDSWESYQIMLKEYLSLGKGVRVVPNPTIHGLPEAVSTKVMIIKVEQENHVHHDLMIFRQAVAKALNQSNLFLYFCTIATGCVELKFVLPDFLFDEIFPLNSQQINIILPNLGITTVYCDTYHNHIKVSI